MNAKRPVWILIDASNWAHADLHAAGLSGAIRNVIRRTELCREYFRPERIAFAFDSPSFRTKIDPGYKANRIKDPPSGLEGLFCAMRDYAIESADDFVKLPGFEADDIIATLAKIAVQSDRNAVLVSRDKDLKQCLVDGRVSQLSSIKHGRPKPDCEFFTARDLFQNYRLSPSQWPEYQALVGDNSDNIRGCDGIGEKAASEILQKCQSLHRFAEKQWLPKLSSRQRKTVTNFIRRDLEKAMKLVTLRNDVPVPGAWHEVKS